MKNIHSCTLVITFFIAISIGLLSCSSPNESTSFENIDLVSSRLAATLPGNEANPYDEAGWVYDELFDTFYTEGNLASNVSDVILEVQSIADANDSFNAIKTSSYQNLSNVRIQYLLENKTTCINDVISASSMSSTGKFSLSSFVNYFITFLETESNCDILYEIIVNYENEVLLDSLLTAADRRIILTTTSVARHSVYRATKKPKKNTDPDWDIFIGNIIAATEGAEYGSAEAVTMALVTGIAQNH